MSKAKPEAGAVAVTEAEDVHSPFNHIQHPKKRAYLAAYSSSGNTLKACQLADIDRSTQWHWTTKDPEFAAAQEVARKMACDVIEAEIERRAIQGLDKPVYQGGKLVGHIREYSDTLLIFLAKGAMPHKYRENASIEHSGPNGGPIEVGPVDLTKLSIERLEQLKAIAMEARAEKLITGGNGVIDAEVVEE